MDCREAQEAILEMFDGPSAAVDAHVAGCPECAAFLASQSALDRELAGLIEPPQLGPDFRAGLRARIRREPSQLRPQWVPDVVHLGSCAVATVVCALVVPAGAGPVLAIGGGVTAASYVLLLMMRMAIEN